MQFLNLGPRLPFWLLLFAWPYLLLYLALLVLGNVVPKHVFKVYWKYPKQISLEKKFSEIETKIGLKVKG